MHTILSIPFYFGYKEMQRGFKIWLFVLNNLLFFYDLLTFCGLFKTRKYILNFKYLMEKILIFTGTRSNN